MSDRTYNMVESRLYEEGWSLGAKLIAGIILARCPNQYGIYDTPRWFLKTLLAEIYTPEQIDNFLEELKQADFIRLYRNGSLMWIVKKWKREQKNPSELNLLGASRFIQDLDNDLCTDFIEVYKGVVRGLQGGSKGYREIDKPLPSTDSDSDSEADSEAEKERRGDKSPAPHYTEFVKELFPDVIGNHLDAQSKVLDEIVRIDKFDFDKLKPVLIWARQDDFWSKVFLSCAGLRKRRDGTGDRMKWEKIKAAFDKEHTGGRTIYVAKPAE